MLSEEETHEEFWIIYFSADVIVVQILS